MSSIVPRAPSRRFPWMPLFVVLNPGHELDDALTGKIRQAIRAQASPRHVPDEIIAAPTIPHTRTGKKLAAELLLVAERRRVPGVEVRPGVEAADDLLARPGLVQFVREDSELRPRPRAVPSVERRPVSSLRLGVAG